MGFKKIDAWNGLPAQSLHTRLSVHFVGIGGIGMSALARWFLAKKWAVSGSDLAESSIARELRKEGVKVKIGHKKGNLPSRAGLLVHTTSVQKGNPELNAAKAKKIAIFSYPKMVGVLTARYRTIAVAGSHGKSTTTALIALILEKAGFDPAVIVGTKLRELHGRNFKNGRDGGYLVLEADEWKAAFLHYFPFVSVVTNIDREHLDFYKTLKNETRAFLKFLGNTLPGGIMILNGDNQNLSALRSPIVRLAKRKMMRVLWYSMRNQIAGKIKRAMRIPGIHNVSNALAAFAVANALGIKQSFALRAIASYRGAWRRMERKGRFTIHNSRFKNKRVAAEVYDDYAHHPTEIKATLAAFREKFPDRTIVCVYQPHQAKRLEALFREFQSAFVDADITLFLPTYEVAGRDKVHSAFTSQTLVRAMQKKDPKKLVFYLANPKNLKRALATLLKPLPASGYSPSPIVVMMGAGDIVDYTDSLIR